MTVIAIATFTSCTNDAIEISGGVSIKVNPSGVIAPFTYEYETGELASFSTDNKLRVRVLAYNEKGKLAAADSAFLTNYEGLMNSTLQLPKGTYTLVSITDVVEHSSSTTFEYWLLSDEEELSQMKITDAGYIGGENKILGIANKTITVSDNAETILLNPTPAGALLYIHYFDIHRFTDVIEYKFESNRSSDYISFNTNGDYVTIPENNNNKFDWRLSFFNPQEEDWEGYTGFYAYYFMFPVTNVSFRFVYSTADATDEILSPNMEISSLAAGDEYGFILDLSDEEDNNNITYQFGKLNGVSSANEMIKTKMPSVKAKNIGFQKMAPIKVSELLSE